MWTTDFHEYSKTKNPKYLVFFLHGYGSNGENLINLAREFEHVLPDAHYIHPMELLSGKADFLMLINGFHFIAALIAKL